MWLIFHCYMYLFFFFFNSVDLNNLFFSLCIKWFFKCHVKLNAGFVWLYLYHLIWRLFITEQQKVEIYSWITYVDDWIIFTAIDMDFPFSSCAKRSYQLSSGTLQEGMIDWFFIRPRNDANIWIEEGISDFWRWSMVSFTICLHPTKMPWP